MRGVILSAGIGSRLRPLTLHKPKCCVTVDGEPILARQLRAYDDAGVTNVTVIAGYLADETKRICERIDRQRPNLDITVRTSEVFANTDNMYSLSLAAKDVAGKEFVLSNGDVVFDTGLLETVVESDADSAVACDTEQFSEEAMKVSVDENDRLTHIDKEISEADAYGCSTDVYRFSADFSRMLFEEITKTIERENEYCEWTELAIDTIVRNKNHDLSVADVSQYRWVEIDDFTDLESADLLFSSLSSLESKEAIFFDLDGTVYLDDELVDDAKARLETLQESGVDVYFLTNNSSRWKDDYVEKLNSLGVECDMNSLLLSTDGVIQFLADTDDEVFVLGTTAMRDALADHGIETDSDDPDHVVVGFDTELTYKKTREATLAIRNGATFLLAHPDAVCPTAEGMVPDCGSIGALVERATDRKPDRIFGKPNAEMIQHVLDANGYAPEDVVVVGDRLETDVQLAENVGCESVCVLTGDATRADVEQSDIDPTLVAPSIEVLDQFISVSSEASAQRVIDEGAS
ncbi:HAD-IIA family hydrolase [Haladaptatus pallidirubidus]|uniref:HAD-IIA family hydrolase n=1 Tax=Haladaptatus pallidirubidus TaxID=1008152 RepID=UPI001D0FABC3|nr:HAD-IIA family hydrolase [Haladaptatus pallidirubidus]